MKRLPLFGVICLLFSCAGRKQGGKDAFDLGAVMKYGMGKIAVFGEAAMFTAQKRNNDAVGFNAPQALKNLQFILNLFHWLAGKYFKSN